MKNMARIAGVTMMALLAGAASATDLTPVPEASATLIEPATPVPMTGEPVPADQVYIDQAVPLFDRVKYVDKHEMHPCAVPRIIQVNDPCAGKHGCCGPQCVFIQICVPPCGCETVRCRKHGDRVRYDFGKYAVDVRVKKGFIVVDYQK